MRFSPMPLQFSCFGGRARRTTRERQGNQEIRLRARRAKRKKGKGTRRYVCPLSESPADLWRRVLKQLSPMPLSFSCCGRPARKTKKEKQGTKRYSCPARRVQHIYGAVLSCSSRPCHFSSLVLGGGPGELREKGRELRSTVANQRGFSGSMPPCSHAVVAHATLVLLFWGAGQEN